MNRQQHELQFNSRCSVALQHSAEGSIVASKPCLAWGEKSSYSHQICRQGACCLTEQFARTVVDPLKLMFIHVWSKEVQPSLLGPCKLWEPRGVIQGVIRGVLLRKTGEEWWAIPSFCHLWSASWYCPGIQDLSWNPTSRADFRCWCLIDAGERDEHVCKMNKSYVSLAARILGSSCIDLKWHCCSWNDTRGNEDSAPAKLEPSWGMPFP